MNRRQAITLLSAGLASRLLPDLPAATPPRQRTLVWVWPDGGAPQNDMFDPKPTAPAGVRTWFGTIPVEGVPELRVTDLFPRLAKVLKYTTVFRAHQASSIDHLTGMAGLLDRSRDGGDHLPARLARRYGGLDFVYAETPGVIDGFDYRRLAFNAPRSVELVWDKTKKLFCVPDVGRHDDRLADRRRLLDALDKSPLAGAGISRHQENMARAYGLIKDGLGTSFTDADVAAYGGANPTALGLLTIRDLVRRNVGGVYIFRDGYWDFHDKCKKRMETRGPQLDAALAAFLGEAAAGRLGDVVIAYASEFGRTPQISPGWGGREHFRWHTSFVYGPTIKRGLAYGRTDKLGADSADERAIDNRVFQRILETAVAHEPDLAIRTSLPPVFTS